LPQARDARKDRKTQRKRKGGSWMLPPEDSLVRFFVMAGLVPAMTSFAIGAVSLRNQATFENSSSTYSPFTR
jgi:hypothetical protein